MAFPITVSEAGSMTRDDHTQRVALAVSHLSGAEFLRAFVKEAALALNVRHLFVGEPSDSPEKIRALAFWSGDKFVEGYEYPLPHSPCENVLGQNTCMFVSGVQELFPLDRDLADFGIEGYVGTPLFARNGTPIGLLIALHDRVINTTQKVGELFEFFAPRVGSELEIFHAEELLEDSETWTRSVVESSPISIVIGDAGGTVLRCNQAFLRMIGRKPNEVLGRNILEFTADGDVAASKRAIEQVLSGSHENTRLEKRYIRSDGETVWGDLSLTATGKKDKDRTHLIGMIVDITERKQLREDYETLFELSPDFVGVGTLQGYFTKVNKSFCEKLGFEEREFYNKPFVEFVFEEDIEATLNALSKAITNPEPQVLFIKNRYLSKGGELIWIDWFVRTNPTDNTFYAYGRDMSEQYLAHEALKVSRDEAERANRSKSEFLASMSHELRTPMNAVLGFAQMLKYSMSEPLSDRQLEYVNNVIDGGEHLNTLLDDVLDLAKVESDQIVLSLEEVEANSVIADCISMVQALAAEKDVTIINTLMGDDGASLNSDPARLKQVLINLLTNAIKYNRAGGTVTIDGAVVEHEYYRLSVIDTGVGIPENKRAMIFEMFQRLDADPMITRDGIGIGLSVSKALVEKMGGQCGVDSEEGAGSTFWIELPLFSNEEVLIWTDEYKVGVDAIDADHQTIFSLTNILSENRVGDEELDAAIEELIDYTQYHFNREEAIMEACGYPDFDAHISHHKRLITRLNEIAADWQADRSPTTRHILRVFLKNWWVDHITNVDKTIAKYADGKDDILTDLTARSFPN